MTPVRRIGFAPSSYAPNVGGVEEIVRNLAREEIRRGGAPMVFTMRWPPDLPARESVGGVPVRRFRYAVPEGPPRVVLKAVPTLPLTQLSLVRAMREQAVDLVHIQCVSHAAWYVANAAGLLRLPLVVSVQGELTMDADGVYETSPMVRHTLRSVVRRAHAVTACSRATLDELERWLGRDLGDRASVVSNGVDAGEFQGVVPATCPNPYVLGMGRLVRQKGFDVLVEAFARVLQHGDHALDLVIAGDGPERAALGDLAARLGVADRVSFPGRVGRRRVAALFRGANVFVLPSRQEPFGIVDLEAMAAGAPVLASATGGVPEVVHDDVNGVLVRPDDVGALASSLDALLRDEPRRRRLREAGFRTAREHDWRLVADRYDDVYAAARRRATITTRT